MTQVKNGLLAVLEVVLVVGLVVGVLIEWAITRD